MDNEGNGRPTRGKGEMLSAWQQPPSFPSPPSPSSPVPNGRISNVEEDRVNGCRFIVNCYERINTNRPRKDFLSPGAKNQRYFLFEKFSTLTLLNNLVQSKK